jgi:hypothetical protein
MRSGREEKGPEISLEVGFLLSCFVSSCSVFSSALNSTSPQKPALKAPGLSGDFYLLPFELRWNQRVSEGS